MCCLLYKLYKSELLSSIFIQFHKQTTFDRSTGAVLSSYKQVSTVAEALAPANLKRNTTFALPHDATKDL